MDLPPFKLVKTSEEWLHCFGKIQKKSRLAIDLEANSLYAYREQICLIQITIPGQDYIIDPLAGFDLSDLGLLLADSEIEKIFHAAEYDLILMKRQFGWELAHLFDTMWAARILGISRCGLASLLKDSYGVTLDKRHQKANWSRRPLPHNLLAYARMDTHFLLDLREKLYARLEELDCLAEAKEIFDEQCRVEPSDNTFNPDDFWSINGVRDLTPRQQAIAKELNIYRDSQAKKFDRPPFKIFDDQTILELASVGPRFVEELPVIHGMTKGQIRRYGRDIIQTIHDAKKQPAPHKPKNNSRRLPEEVSERYDILRNWRKERAKARGVESDVILSRDALWELAWLNPQRPEDLAQINRLGPWRQTAYGDEIIQLLNHR